MSHSTPVERDITQPKGKSALQASSKLITYNMISEVQQFPAGYFSSLANYDQNQLNDRRALISQIQGTQAGEEVSMYSNSAPLLRLLNGLSKLVHDSLPDARTHNGLVFCAANNKSIRNPFYDTVLLPDVVALWKLVGVLSKLTSDSEPNFDLTSIQTWSDLVTVGEVNVGRQADGQIGNYLRNLLQLHPENTGVFGFSARTRGYRLLYHDAAVIQKSQEYPWTDLGPLFKLVGKLYKKPFRDSSMAVVQPKDPLMLPSWVVKTEDYTFFSYATPQEDKIRAEQGPGQRRFAAFMMDTLEGQWFMKEYWRDTKRRFFEWMLYQAAHKGKNIPGLMSIESGGHVLDSDENKIKTTDLETSTTREKVRIISRDVGLPLDRITSLRQFLCVMYDACVVQRNLYRKAKMLHRDISDSNIMAAPLNNPKFYERCAEGYDEVKYLNQVLAKDEKVKPKPACLVIDLGNGADLTTDEGTAEVLTTRTGTPKFIARSVSSGRVLKGLVSENLMPKLEGGALELCEFLDETRYKRFNRAIDDAPLLDERSPNLHFKHQLFHDAESVFWVIAWTLARSTRPVYKAEVVWHDELEVFIYAMSNHIPGPKRPDSRLSVPRDPDTWRNILHQDLASMAPMFSQMHGYIWPEWTLRDKLDPEHAHEALMRLLLAEIVRIDKTVDIPLKIGTRSLPHTSTPASSHLSTTISSRAANSQLQGPPKKPPPVPSAPGPSSSKKRNVSELGDEAATNPTRRRSARLAARRAQTPLDELIQRILALTWENRKFARKIENLSEDNSTTDPCIMTEVACD